MKSSWFFGLTAILVDQVAKALIVHFNLPYYSGHLYQPFIAVAVIAGLLVALRKDYSIGLILILSGGISNCLDFIVRENIIDILVIKNLFFNLADVFIVLGFYLTLTESLQKILKAK